MASDSRCSAGLEVRRGSFVRRVGRSKEGCRAAKRMMEVAFAASDRMMCH
jgi:hypothetical protein